MAVMPNGTTTGSGDAQESYGPMSIDAVLDAEVEAEHSIRAILLDLQSRTGRRIEWVKVERDLHVTVNTISK